MHPSTTRPLLERRRSLLRTPVRAFQRRTIALVAASAAALVPLALATSPAQAARTPDRPLIVTQIVPNPTGDDIFEFFQLYNTTDTPISLTDGSFGLAYTSNLSVPESTRTDYRLTVSGTSTSVPAHGSLVLWNWTPSMNSTLTDADFRSFWASRNPAAPQDYALGRVTGTSGMSNSAARGIRVLDATGDNLSYGFYDSAAFASDRATNFALPATTRSAQMRVFSTGALAAPGVVEPAQVDTTGVAPAGSGFSPAAPHGTENAFGLIDTDDASAKLSQMHLMGTVMLVKNGQTAIVSNGLANAATGLANGRGVLYPTASLQKAMTGTIVMQLISEGTLTFDTKLSDFVPQAPKSQSITVDMLLKHTSGISMPEMPVYVDPSDRSRGQVVLKTQSEQVQNAIATMKVGNQGSFSYSNGNYTMLAAIISAVTGQDFEQVMQTRIFDRAGMRDTYFWDGVPADRLPSVAQEYTYADGSDYSTVSGPVATPSLQSTLLGAGNVFTTIDDLYRFYTESNGGALLTTDEYQRISASSLQNGYGGGLYHYPGNIKRARGSASTDEQGGRYNSFVYGREDNDDLVLILSNQSLISGNPAPMNSYDAFAESLYLALHTDPDVRSIDPVAAEITVGDALTLPGIVRVTLDESPDPVDLGVTWEAISPDALNTPGRYSVNGKVSGLHQNVAATVLVKTAIPATPDVPPTTPPPATETSNATAPAGGSSDTTSSAASLPEATSTPSTIAETGLDGTLVAGILAAAGTLLALGSGAFMLSRRPSSREE